VRPHAASLALAFTLACARPPAPATLDARSELCGRCHMVVSDPRLAAQVVAPGEEPIFFDDIGCLREYLRGGSPLARGAAVYVADHRTKQWVAASAAVYTRSRLATPMGSGLIAHADAASRDADAEAAGGSPVAAREVLGG
jgi:copper chaperone NosL